jgi:hypothetical protein
MRQVRRLFAVLVLCCAAFYGGQPVAAALDQEGVEDLIKDAVGRLRHEYKTLLETAVDALRDDYQTQLNNVKAELTTVRLNSVELGAGLSKVRSRIRALADSEAASGGHRKKQNLDDVTALVTKLMDKHKRNSRSLAARLDALEETVQDQTATEIDQNGKALVSPTRGRHLSSTESVDLQDAALWMQAKNAKILFGETGDTTLRRSKAHELTTDHDFVVQRDMQVNGENWHLTTMIEARENITLGDVISLCEGKACVGYGLEPIGRKGTNNPAANVGVISLGGSMTISVMFYRQWSASLESKPFMRMIKTIDTLTNDYTADPKVGDEKNIGDAAVSELRMVGITDASFIMCYRKAASSNSDKLKVQGAVRLGEIESIDGSSLKVAEEVGIALQDGYGFKRGIPIRLGDAKYAIVYEITDVDAADKWLGSAGLAIGTIGLGASAHRGVDLGSAEIFSKYVSDVSAAAFNNDKHVAVAYRKQDALGSQDVGMVTLIDTSTTIPVVKTSIEFSPIRARFMDLIMISEKTVSIVYREPTRNFAGKGLLVNLVQSDTQLLATTPVPIAEESSIDNSYLMAATRISEAQMVIAYRNSNGRPRLVDADVVGTTIVVGTPRRFAVEDHIAQSFSIAGLASSAFLLTYQDNEANVPHVATAVIAKTHGGALRTGVATSSGGVGEDVQVAIEGLVKVPSGTVEVNGQGVPMTPGARYCE